MSDYKYYVKGDWDAICDVCGFKRKASQLRKRWDGLMVDDKCWEPRQPQDFVRAKIDTQVVPWSRPEQSDVFLFDTFAKADFGGADFMQADKIV